MLPSKANDNSKKRKQNLPHSAARQKHNDRFLKELADIRYGNTKEGKERYDEIGEKFAFWKTLTNEQKRSCAVNHSAVMTSRNWNEENGIKVSYNDKDEFLFKRMNLDRITYLEKLECLLRQDAKKIDKSRVFLIENPLEAAFSRFSANFEEFDRATRDVPESDFYIQAWFKKRAELHERTSKTSDEVQITKVVLQTPRSENVSSTASSMKSTGNVPQVQRNLKRPRTILEEEFLSGSDGPSSSKQIPSYSGQVSIGNQDASSSSALNTTRQVTDECRSPSQSQRGAPTRRSMDVMSLGSRIGTNMPTSSTSRIEETVGRDSLLLKILKNPGMPDNLSMNTPTGINYGFAQGVFAEADYSHLSTPRRDNLPSTSTWFPTLDIPQSYSFGPTSLGDNRRSRSQPSTSSLPTSIPTDGVTHEATMSIAPPPRMLSSIMNHFSTQMKKREEASESVGLDFGPIQVKLRATGKEMDDTIAFLKNMTAQLESAKQGGSY
ncbi:hypothetical protein B9Z55_026201 [Caenorhabditis nigoni]|uniref:Uncharacterized protein n=1 Tax=Caenorhabditis nigoni TaxID=1611254 RepID=A0A2G5T1P0_9PELO|nr:hypothetical protein B9Z55_026201 [Caenorhabditis nigoni]